MPELRNLVSQAELKERLAASTEPRKTISFYKYHPIEAPGQFRDEMYVHMEALGVLGRVYIAHEGINAQISVPERNFPSFAAYLDSIDFLRGVRLNIAVDDDGKSFWVLNVKVRAKIVADGIDDPTFSVERSGRYVNAAEFNELADRPDTIVVDMRNYYEYEVGHFEGALEVSSDTFREQLPMAVQMLQEHKDENIIMYCTGGIRCEKASAYLLHHGFTNVCHLEGGIIEYVHQVRAQGLENKFRGKNFVFDDRLGEQITDEIISHCHQCGEKCADHRNCANDACHLLFIQCASCRAKFHGSCSESCAELRHLPAAEQAKLTTCTIKSGGAFNNSQSLRRVRFFDARKQ